MSATLPTFQPFELGQTRDEHNRLLERYPTCIHCGDAGVVDVERRCRPCWRVVELGQSPRAEGSKLADVRAAALRDVDHALSIRELELATRLAAAEAREDRVGIIADLDGRRCEVIESRATVAELAGERGIIGRHWVAPSPAAAARPRSVVSSAGPLDEPKR